jgi:hypothetical protein
MSDLPSTLPPPPPPPPPAAPRPGNEFDFAKPFTFVFEDQRWVNKILMGGLFYLAGFLIIGWFFILGYCARLARNVVAGEAVPLPEWDDLGEFFSEGLRLFAVVLVYIVPMIALMGFFIVPLIMAEASGNRALRELSGGMAGCLACLIMPLSLAIAFFMPASLLFASVEQRFNAAFDFSRIWPFIKNNIGNYLLALVVYLIARTLSGVGIVLLCIGVVFTGFWSFLITTHGYAQAYRLARK